VWAYLTGQASVRSLCRLTKDGGCTEQEGEAIPPNDAEVEKKVTNF